MIRSVIKIAVIAIAAVLIYNYFFGTSEEKENAHKVFGQLRGVVVSVADLVKSERAKFDAGKYDAALDKLGEAYRTVREQAQHVDGKVIKRLDELERRKTSLEQDLDSIEQGDLPLIAPPTSGKKAPKKDPKAEDAKAAKAADQQRRKEALQKELEALLRDSDDLLKEAQQ